MAAALKGERATVLARRSRPRVATTPPAGSRGRPRWLRLPDVWLPLGADDARAAFEEAHRLVLESVRVELACPGGRGRTGTALACIAQLGGVSAGAAGAWVRANYDPRAVETPWQRRYVTRFLGADPARPNRPCAPPAARDQARP